MLELCVIFGGQSPEHEISRKSVTSVLNNLNKDKYNISTIGITKTVMVSVHGRLCKRLKVRMGAGYRKKKKTRRRQFFLRCRVIRLYLFLIYDKVKIHPDVIFLYFTVSSERKNNSRSLNFREYLMSVWA